MNSKPDLCTGVPAESFVDLIDDDRYVLETLAEQIKAFGLHLLKLLTACLSVMCAVLKRCRL